jgi:SAM-dependent methyltransferase
MKVLDVGCGAGDVSLLVASLVGASGSVVGVDNNPEVLRTARQRVSAAGLSNVSFIAGDIRDVVIDTDFDAVVGRFILVYVADQATTLRTMVRHLRPGGIVAFQEPDFSLSESLVTNEITPPMYRQLVRWWAELFRHIGSAPNMSVSLSEAFLQAGLPLPQMYLEGGIVHGPEWNGYDYVAETLRSTLPLLTQFGITTAQEAEVDTFAERLREETFNRGSFIVLPLAIGTWTRKAL